jgi:beta-glucosidase
MKRSDLLIVAAVLTGLGLVHAHAAQKPVYKDPAAPIESRINDLLGRMTLEDKCRQIDIWHPTMDLSKPDVLKKAIAAVGDTVSNGIGFLQFQVEMNNNAYIARFNAIQKYFMEQTRLGIPAISNSDGCHGFMGNEDKATVFPAPPLLGSSWDTLLIERVYTAVAKEMRGYGVHHAATPVLDLLRDPRFGRADEFLGEDPYHAARMGVAAIFGLQGRSPRIDENHLLACGKHFTGHGQPEGGTNLAPANFSERVLREIHLYPFEMAVKTANVRTMMASYNEIDGIPNHANKWLLTDILRGEWGFTGYVISDYDGVNRMIYRQHACANQAEAAKKAIAAGMDFECPSSWGEYCFSQLPVLIKSGELKESVLDSAVSRVLRNKFILGLFENPYVKKVGDKEKLAMQNTHRLLAREAAEKGMILLKNSNKTLPFDEAGIKALAVIGPNADEVHYGNYSNDKTPGVSILEGLTMYGKGKFEVFYAEGFKIYENDTTIKAEEKTAAAENRRIAEAMDVAQKCDAVLLVMGGNELTCREEWANHTGDYYNLDLLGRQDDLAKAIVNLGKKTAVLLINGRPHSINYVAQNAPAIIEAWYVGQEQGSAVANVLFGTVNPSGKLAVTFPRHVGQLPVYYNRKPYVHESPYINGAYSPLYPFGFGLSYTTFKYANLTLSAKKVNAGEPVTVSVDVSNVGDKDGDEIVQLYIRDMVSSVTRPVQELKDFTRIQLKKGETKNIAFTITPEKLQFYGPDMKRVVEPGEFEVQVGTNSTEYLSGRFEVSGSLKVE